MSSGVKVSDDAVKAFNDFKLSGKKTSPNYIIYRVNDDKTEIVIDKEGRTDKYDEFVDLLPENDCRYAVYDFTFDLPNGEGHRSKIVFITWSPDTTPIRSKMIYASSKDAIRRALTGVHLDIQGTDYSEVAYETVLERASKGVLK